MLNRRLVGRKVEEQFMEASDVFAGFGGSVLLHILRQGKHKRLAVVKDIDFLSLLLGEIENRNQSHRHHHSTHRHEYYPEQTYLTE